MITVGFIQEDRGVYYYYTFVSDTLSIAEHPGPEGPFKRKFEELMAQMFLAHCEDFILLDKEIVDRGKEVHSYTELAQRVKDFMKWGHENIDIAPGSVAQNGYVVTKYMKGMIDMISIDHPMRKDLIFINSCIKDTWENKFEVE